jgi:hypothetical protein
MRPYFSAALLLFALITPLRVVAQHDHEHNQVPAIPSSLQIEHEQIHQELSALLKLSGKTGDAAREVAAALHEHFEAEEEFAMPPLGALQDLANGVDLKEAKGLLKLSETLELRMPEMLREHNVIKMKIDALRAAGKQEVQPAAIAFADKLQLHAQNEEQILYPSAIVIGKYLKLLASSRKTHIK